MALKISAQTRTVVESCLSQDWTYYFSSPILLVLPRASQLPALSDLESLLKLSTLTSVQFENAVFLCTSYTDTWQHWRSATQGFYFVTIAQTQGPLYLVAYYEDVTGHMTQAAKACATLMLKLKDA